MPNNTKNARQARNTSQTVATNTIVTMSVEIKVLHREVTELRQQCFPQWIPEKEAAEIIHLNPRYLRYLATTEARSIKYRRTRALGFQYLKSDIDNFKL